MRRLAGLSICLLVAACGDDSAANVDTSGGSSGSNGSDATGGSNPGDGSGSDPSGATGATSDTAPATGDGSDGPTTTDATTGDPEPFELPPANGGLDYQLGGAYEPPAGVEIVSRDRNDPPAAGLYNICYVNGYQTQPDEQDWWVRNNPELLLHDDQGELFIDPDWNEILLDIRTPDNRDALAAIVGDWIAQCAADGYDAVEIDNLDTYSRSDGMISEDDAVDYMVMLSAAAHEVGLAIAQKNSAEIVSRRDEMGTDFVVAEECNRWDECQDYIDAYGDVVLVIEYRAMDFDAGCTDFPQLSIVLRDLDLVPAGSGGYVYDAC